MKRTITGKQSVCKPLISGGLQKLSEKISTQYLTVPQTV